jgi:multidrug efflux pump subunit AcrB
VREDIRTVQVVARGRRHAARSGPIGDFTLVGAGQRIPLSQVGKVEVRMEDPILRRRDRTPTITVRGDIAEACSRRTSRPPSRAAAADHRQAAGRLPHRAGRLHRGVGQGHQGHAAAVPDHDGPTAADHHLQVRSISAMVMVFLTSPLGLIGVVPTLLLFSSPSASMRWSA